MHFISLLVVFISTSSLNGYKIYPPSRTILKKEVKDIQCRRFRSSFILRNDLLGEEIKELREGIDIFQKETFKALYDGKQVKWEPKTVASVELKSADAASVDSIVAEVAPAAPESEVLAEPTDSPVSASVPAAAEITTPASSPVEASKEIEIAQTPATSTVSPVEVSEPIEKTEPPTPAPKAAEKVAVTAAVATSPPVEKLDAAVIVSQVKKEVAPEALVLKDIPINSDVTKDAGVPSTEDVLRAQQAVAKTFLTIMSEGQQESNTEPPLVKVEASQPLVEKVAPKPPAAKVSAPKPVVSSPSTTAAPVQTTSKSGESPFENLFGFLKSDPNVMLAAQSRAQGKPTAPPAVARALSQSPKSVAPVKEEDTPPPKSQLLTIADARKEAANAKDVPVVAAASKPSIATPAAAGSTGGLFDFFSNKLPVSEKKEPVPAEDSATKKIAAPVTPVVKASVPVKTVPPPSTTTTKASPAASGGGFFSFLASTPTPEKKEPVPTEAVATKATVKTPAPVAPAVKASAVPVKTIPPATTKPSSSGGGFFGFLASTPAPEKKESAPAAEVATKATVKTQAPVTPVVKVSAVPAKTVAPVAAKATPPPAGGGLFGFLASTPAPEKKEPAPAVAVATKATVKTPAPVTPAVKVSAVPAKTVAPVAAKATPPSGGGFFGFLASTPAPEKKEPAPAVAVATKAVVKTPAPVVKASAPVKTVPPPTTTTTTKTSPAASGGGFFGFLASTPAPAKKEPAPAAAVATKATVKTQAPATPVVKVSAVPAKTVAPVAAKATPPPSGGGLFGFLASTPAPEKKEPAPAVAVATKATVKTQAPVTPVVKVSAVPTKTVAPVAAKASPAGGGFFSFLASTPAPEKKEPAPAVAVATKATEKTVKTPAPVTSVVKPVSTVPTTTKASPPASGGGFFGFLASTPAPEKKESAPSIAVATKATEKAVKAPPAPATPAVKVVAPTAAKAKVEPVKVSTPKPATAMNAKFTSTVSEALKKDSTKIGLFQTATDNFRSGNSDATSFLASLDKLFGSNPAVLDTIVPQLIAELPEKKIAEQLKIVYEKKVVAAKAAASKLPPPIKAPAKVPTLQKALVENQLKAIIAGTTQADSFFTSLEKELGRTRLKEISEELLAMLPKDKADKVRAVFLAKKL